jgi:polyisoprenyl-phosphate glycosyltransferase
MRLRRTMPHISIVAPVYNEAAVTLKALVDRVADALRPITADFEIILVDDGSRNETWQDICAIAAANPKVKAIRLTRNFGQHPAIAAGLDHASGDWVVVMDSDLQDRPEVIPELYETVKAGFDVAFVDRVARPESLFHQFMASTFYKLLNLLAGQRFSNKQANFSIISREVVEAFRHVPDRERFYGGTVRWLGFHQTSITARHGERFAGNPAHNLKARFRFALQLILGYSTRLLYVAIVLGLLMAATSFVMAAGIVVYAISYPELPVPGWPSVITAVFFAAGVTNVMLGLIGIYLGDLTERSKGRPPYLVQRRVGDLPGNEAAKTQSLAEKLPDHRAQAS